MRREAPHEGGETRARRLFETSENEGLPGVPEEERACEGIENTGTIDDTFERRIDVG